MKKKILLTSVFKPFGIDNLYSRKESIPELFHNQLTRYQDIFSVRLFYQTYGLHTIASHIENPVTVLDFPSLKRFKKEIQKGYDIIGIGSILANFQKVKKMVEEIRRLSPGSTIVIGGFCANIPDIKNILGVDHVCVGEGISFMRELLGLSPEFEFKNPDIFSFHREIMGIPLLGLQKFPQITVGLGCSYGCDFCSVSHFFGKKHIKFFKTGEELFNEMVRLEKKFHTNHITFIGDDNFLLDLKRAEELRLCVIKSGKTFSVSIFASADRIIEFGVKKLAEIGVDNIWLGRESSISSYKKNQGIDMATLIKELRYYGIKTILSSILLLDEHTSENIDGEIDDHLSCFPDCSQFAHYSPLPGTPLYKRMDSENRLLKTVPYEEWHSFKQSWFIHPEFTPEQAEQKQIEAYTRDFNELGPTIVRFINTTYEGWKNLSRMPETYLRRKAENISKDMWKYRVILRASASLLKDNKKTKDFTLATLSKIESSFGESGLFEKITAAIFTAAGHLKRFRTRHFGDLIQPRTKVYHYNHKQKLFCPEHLQCRKKGSADKV